MSELDITAQPHQVVDTWAAAERAGDTQALDALLTDEFTGIGPHGFALDKGQWLARYDSGDLVNEAFAAAEVATRTYGDDTAIATGVQTQQAAYRGSPFDGRFRLSLVLVRRGDRWAIANIQLSAIADS